MPEGFAGYQVLPVRKMSRRHKPPESQILPKGTSHQHRKASRNALYRAFETRPETRRLRPQAPASSRTVIKHYQPVKRLEAVPEPFAVLRVKVL